jgi:hypothetical protein
VGIIDFNVKELAANVTNVLANNTQVEGGPLLQWWQRQARKVQQDVMDQVRLSLEAGESTQQAVTRLVGGSVGDVQFPGVLKTSRRRAEAIVRTAIADVVNRARLQSLQDMNDVVKAVQQISTLDNRTTLTCIAYSEKVWDIDTLSPLGHDLPFNGGPPRHFNCRSSLVPVLRSFAELGIDAEEVPLATRASMDGEVPGDITFDAWLRGKSRAFQDDLLGRRRAQLWRTKRITLTQLVDFRGEPLTLNQLEKLARG